MSRMKIAVALALSVALGVAATAPVAAHTSAKGKLAAQAKVSIAGRYLGYMRQLKSGGKAEVWVLPAKKGVIAAIVRARKLSRHIRERSA